MSIKVPDRYIRNLGLLTPIHQNKLLTKSIAIIGLGGQGGYIAEYLARLGVKELVLFDPDKYDTTNLNRQVFATENTIAISKVQAATQRIREINSTIKVIPYTLTFGTKYVDLVSHCDFIFACADMGINSEDNRKAFRMALEQGIPVIDVAVTDFGIALLSCWKDFDLWDDLTADYCAGTIERAQSIYQPAYLCAMASSMAVHEMIKYFTTNYPQSCMDIRIIYDMFENSLIFFRKPTAPIHSVGYEKT